ncbi:hypothetical protein EJ03DRAFT_385108 [Teratosphaeria nubilosa]|uniref:Uncharacterized protein n=1 Tax=Teratosphaeria nubilosa TaxID=161662 RepID=A0A6G1KYF5_9PEZI|nr:hypothetical protein EJ03DRAFT_385108 [Teratosphaeria nubilosa]
MELLRFALQNLYGSLRPGHPLSEAVRLAGTKARAGLTGLTLYALTQTPCGYTVGFFLENFEGQTSEIDEHIEHDLALLRTIRRSKPLSLSTIDLKAPSSFALPLRVFSSRVDGTPPKKPSNIDGWQDIAHLSSFTAEDKKTINDLEEKLGYVTTKFD